MKVGAQKGIHLNEGGIEFMTRLFTAHWCKGCVQVSRMLKERGIKFEEVNVDTDPKGLDQLVDHTQQAMVPTLVLEDTFLVGCKPDDLERVLGEEFEGRIHRAHHPDRNVGRNRS